MSKLYAVGLLYDDRKPRSGRLVLLYNIESGAEDFSLSPPVEYVYAPTSCSIPSLNGQAKDANSFASGSTPLGLSTFPHLLRLERRCHAVFLRRLDLAFKK